MQIYIQAESCQNFLFHRTRYILKSSCVFNVKYNRFKCRLETKEEQSMRAHVDISVGHFPHLCTMEILRRWIQPVAQEDNEKLS